MKSLISPKLKTCCTICSRSGNLKLDPPPISGHFSPSNPLEEKNTEKEEQEIEGKYHDTLHLADPPEDDQIEEKVGSIEGQQHNELGQDAEDIGEARRLMTQIKQMYENTDTSPSIQDKEVNLEQKAGQANQPGGVNLTYRFGYCIPVVRTVLEHNGVYRSEGGAKASIVWNPKMNSADQFMRLYSFQKVNHFPHSAQLGRKDCLNKNVYYMQIRFPKEFNFLPRTYILPQEEPVLLDHCSNRKLHANYYIFKPKASSQGKGIFLCTEPAEVLAQRDREAKHFVVSEYITNPLLIKGYKFDLRIYVLVTSLNPLKIYVYQDGLARFCAEKFSLRDEDLSNRYAHLTNYAINKHSKHFKICTDSSEIGRGSKCLISHLKVL